MPTLAWGLGTLVLARLAASPRASGAIITRKLDEDQALDQLFLELCGWALGLAPGLGTAGVLGTQGWHAQPLPLCPRLGLVPHKAGRGVDRWKSGESDWKEGSDRQEAHRDDAPEAHLVLGPPAHQRGTCS